MENHAPVGDMFLCGCLWENHEELAQTMEKSLHKWAYVTFENLCFLKKCMRYEIFRHPEYFVASSCSVFWSLL